MTSILFMVLSFISIEIDGPIADKAGILTESQEKTLLKRLKRIQNEASLEFLVSSSTSTNSEEVRLEHREILIHVSKDSQLLKVSASPDILELITASKLERIANKASEGLSITGDYYLAIDKAINNVTHVWLTDYYQESQSTIKAYIALGILLVLIFAGLIKFSKLFEPFYKHKIDRWERNKHFDQKSPF